MRELSERVRNPLHILGDVAHVPLRDETRSLFAALVERIGADTSAERRASLGGTAWSEVVRQVGELRGTLSG